MKTIAGLFVLLLCASNLWAGPAKDRPLTLRDFLSSMNRVETQLADLKTAMQGLTEQVSKITLSSPVGDREVPSPRSLPGPVSIPIEETIFHLGRKLVPSEPKNFVSSPLSAAVCLNMLLTGTRGTTRRELQGALSSFHDEKDVLDFYKRTMERLNSNSEVRLNIANGIFYQNPLNTDYESKVKDYFHGEVRQVDFNRNPTKATDLVNQWVSDRTEAKIPKLFEELDSSTELVGVNALYFKGEWQQSFNESQTKNKPFHKSTNEIVNLPTMFGRFKDIKIVISKKPGFTMFSLPFKGRQYAMYFVLPTGDDFLQSLLQLESSLNSETINQWITKMKPISASLSVPKFKIETSIDVKKILQGAGVTKLFGPGADLSGMFSRPGTISEIIQKVVMEMSETGAEATAATAFVPKFRAASLPQIDLNRPFKFFLMEEAIKVVLFSGRFVGSD